MLFITVAGYGFSILHFPSVPGALTYSILITYNLPDLFLKTDHLMLQVVKFFHSSVSHKPLVNKFTVHFNTWKWPHVSWQAAAPGTQKSTGCFIVMLNPQLKRGIIKHAINKIV